MALEITCVVGDPNSVRGLQGAATDEGTEIGWRGWCTGMDGGEHPRIGIMVGVDPWNSAHEGSLVCWVCLSSSATALNKDKILEDKGVI